jgi:2-desacetyl-2-hydroxyethyl bacteriochlorophyllide A dehydrogenase
MKALYFLGEKHMELRDIPAPVPGPGDYSIRVVANGVCGSDFDGYMGRSGRRIPPMIMGHEVSGVITAKPVGGRFNIGQRVVVFPKDFCGECAYCKQDMVNVCPNGICMGVMTRDGSMTEQLVIGEKYLLPFADSLSFAVAAMTEPLAVAMRSVNKLGDRLIGNSEYCVVVGTGTIGLLVISLLKLRGAKNIIVSDASDFRLNIAQRVGADFTINPIKEKFSEVITRITNGAMCDYSVEAVGITPTVGNAIEALKIGGTALWIGNSQKIIEINMQKIVTTELTIRGNYVYGLEDFSSSLKLLEEGKIDVSPIITHYRPLSEGVEVFRQLEDNRDGSMLKIILES